MGKLNVVRYTLLFLLIAVVSFNVVYHSLNSIRAQKNFISRQSITSSEDTNELIPKIIHFIFISNPKYKGMSMAVAMAIKSAKVIYPDWQVWLHHSKDFPMNAETDQYFKIASQYIDKFIMEEVPETIAGKPIQFIQHKADWLRLQILKEHGGIYLDTDVFSIRPISNNIRKYNTVLARQFGDSICNAMIMTQPNSTFINAWIDSYLKDYRPDQWGWNSLILSLQIAIAYETTGEVNILDKQLFFYGYPDNIQYSQNGNVDHHLFFHTWHYGAIKDWNLPVDQWTVDDLKQQSSTYATILLRYYNWDEAKDGPSYRRQWSGPEILKGIRGNPWRI
jgi:hypothetical protein